ARWGRLPMDTDVLKEALPGVGGGSCAKIRTRATLSGTPVVYSSGGTTRSPALRDGDTIRARPKAAIGDLTEDIGAVGPEFSALGVATKELARKIDRPGGTLGNARAYGFEDFADVSAGTSSLYGRSTHGTGAIAKWPRGQFLNRASQALAAADSIRALLSSKR